MVHNIARCTVEVVQIVGSPNPGKLDRQTYTPMDAVHHNKISGNPDQKRYSPKINILSRTTCTRAPVFSGLGTCADVGLYKSGLPTMQMKPPT